MRFKTQVNLNEAQIRTYTFLVDKGFSLIEPADYLVLHEYHTDNKLHELSMTTCCIWAFAYKAVYKMIQSYLISVWFYRDGEVFFYIHRPYSTEYDVHKIIDELYQLAFDAGLDSLKLWPVEERFLEEYKAMQGYTIDAQDNHDWGEYTYKITDILDLTGNINYYKRKRLKKFIDNPCVEIKPLTKENFNQCFEVEEVWCTQKDCVECDYFGSGCAKDSLEQMRLLFDTTIHQGIMGYYDGKPAAYAIWDKIDNGKTTVVYFAKGIVPDYNLYLYYVIAQNFAADSEWIDNGPDMGNEGLRLFKSHLSNFEFRNKYLCTFRKN